MAENAVEKFMFQALRLALKGEAWVAPNPRVGAVLVKNGKVIGQGWHQKFGGPHAEINALEDCRRRGHDPKGATLYVTLEPCCHRGKTPPCTKAIARAGIAAVEAATLDDFDRVAGRGAAWLRQHGIEVKVGLCQEEARRQNFGFFKLQKTATPQVILKWAQSLDGRLAWPKLKPEKPAKKTKPGVTPPIKIYHPREELPPRTPGGYITGAAVRKHVHLLRAQCGAVLAGMGTVLADDPMLNVRLPGRHFQPIRVILDSHLRLPLDTKLVQTAEKFPTLVYTTHQTMIHQTRRVDNLTATGVEVIGLAEQNGRLHLGAVCAELGSRGITDILVEGGPTLLSEFLRQDLGDKVMIYQAPLLIGGAAPSLSFSDPVAQLHGLTRTVLDDDLLIEGYIHPVPPEPKDEDDD